MGGDAPGEIRVSTATSGIFAKVEGREGAPWITLLHSLATDHRLWDREAAVLGERFRVLRLDMRGHGRSATSLDRFSIEDLRDDVIAVWTQLGIDRSLVLGLSIGGMVALALGLSQPQRIAAIVAADCRADAPPPFRAMWDQRRRLLREQGIDAIVAATLPTWFTASTLERRLPMVEDTAQTIRGTSLPGYLGATRALQGLNLLPALGTLTCPVLYLVGEEDGAHPEAMRAMQRSTPGSELVVLPGAAHLSNLEQPEAFMAAVLAFLDRQVEAS